MRSIRSKRGIHQNSVPLAATAVALGCVGAPEPPPGPSCRWVEDAMAFCPPPRQLTGSGEWDMQPLHDAMYQVRDGLNACYEAAALGRSELRGSWRFHVCFAATGRPRAVEVHGPEGLMAPGLHECLVEQICQVRVKEMKRGPVLFPVTVRFRRVPIR